MYRSGRVQQVNAPVEPNLPVVLPALDAFAAGGCSNTGCGDGRTDERLAAVVIQRAGQRWMHARALSDGDGRGWAMGTVVVVGKWDSYFLLFFAGVHDAFP